MRAISSPHPSPEQAVSLVQELVRLHGGSITATSEVGEGTTFIASLPLGSAHLPPDQIADTRRPGSVGVGAMPYVEEALRWLPDGDEERSELPAYPEAVPVPYLGDEHNGDDRPRVLVADDNADMRQYVVRLLAEQFRTEAVADGEAALAAAKRSVPDLILTAVMMPRLDGFGLLRALRADPSTSGVPVIMLSARAGEESRVEGMEAGADDYLVKPFGARELLARVRAHLQMARMRQQANETLRQGEERLRMALTAARMAAWEIDLSTGNVVLSDNAAEVFGLPLDALPKLFDTGFNVVHPDDAERHKATVDKAVAEGGSYVSQFRLGGRDEGPTIWLEDRGHAVGNGSGQTTRLVGVVMDITERKLAEEAIRSGEARTRTILESIADGFYALDRDWRFTYVNSAGEKLLDRAHGDLIGKRLWDEYPGAVGSAFELAYRRVASERIPESFTAYYPDFDRWYAVSAYPATDGLTVYFRDVSEQKLIEERLHASEERRLLALDGAELGAWNMDPATMSIRTDARLRAIFGFPEEFTDYSEAVLVVHPDDEAAVHSAVAAAIRVDDPLPYALEYRIVRPDGSIRWVFAKGRAKIEGVGPARRTVSFDGTVADITERKRAEEEREYLVDQLRQQDTRKDEFLATLAHELRNPLAPISNGLHIMRLAGLTGSVEQARMMMDRQLTQMNRLVDDLLDVGRITRGKLELRTEVIELRTVIELAVEIARPLIDQASHELTVTLPDEPTFVDGDVTRLAQVVSNLLTNAAKYTDQGGRIHLRVDRLEREIFVSVTDNGIGIPVAMLTRVFDMFTQVDRRLEKTTGGLGIGLSLVKGLVEMHGGTIEARSDGEGLGSEFVVRLPIVAMGVRTPEYVAVNDDDAVPASVRRVLVVDDNQDAADSLAQLLELLGHDVRTAHDGEAGIAAAEAFLPDVVLLDIGMPKLNGYDACRRIRDQAWGSGMTLVAMTGWGQEEDKRRSLEAGFDGHLVKPVEFGLLQKLMARTEAA